MYMREELLKNCWVEEIRFDFGFCPQSLQSFLSYMSKWYGLI